MKILAPTDFSTRSNLALRQAGLLAQAPDAQLDILHIVDDDRPSQLVEMEKREALHILVEQINSVAELRGVHCRPTVVIGDPFDGILRAAADGGADLIVMGAHRKQILLDIFIGTTIERVIRKGTFPVLMVNNEAQQRYERVVAPVDISDASVNALRAALSTGLISDSGATLLHAFLPLVRGAVLAGGADQAGIDDYVASERQRIMDELVAMLVSNDLGGPRWSLRVQEGGPMDVILQVISETRPDLLVMGTHGRSGLSKALIGSVTEEALRSLTVDILVVPPGKR